MTKKLQNLFLIGGGVMRNGETENIDRWLISKAKRNETKPKVIFIPSASNDLRAYAEDFENRYSSYGANVETLYLVDKNPSPDFVRKIILNSNLVYFGGGSAELLLKVFEKYDLENICFEATKNGTLIAGLSAGAIIWGQKFLTFDRVSSNFTKFRIKKGLGWVNNLIIPHYSNVMLEDKKVKQLIAKDISLPLLKIPNSIAVYWGGNQKIKLYK